MSQHSYSGESVEIISASGNTVSSDHSGWVPDRRFFAGLYDDAKPPGPKAPAGVEICVFKDGREQIMARARLRPDGTVCMVGHPEYCLRPGEKVRGCTLSDGIDFLRALFRQVEDDEDAGGAALAYGHVPYARYTYD